MGDTKWAAYQPPTASQLERRQLIRDRIEQLSIRPLRDSIRITDHDIKRLQAGIGSGLIFTVGMILLVVGTFLVFGR